MGTTWEVYAYRRYSLPFPDEGIKYGYRYEIVYQGNSMLRAFWAAAWAKNSVGCVRVEWR